MLTYIAISVIVMLILTAMAAQENDYISAGDLVTIVVIGIVWPVAVLLVILDLMVDMDALEEIIIWSRK